MAVLGLRFCARALSSCGKRGPLFIALHGPLTIAASPAAEHRLQTRRLSNCGSRAHPYSFVSVFFFFLFPYPCTWGVSFLFGGLRSSASI